MLSTKICSGTSVLRILKKYSRSFTTNFPNLGYPEKKVFSYNKNRLYQIFRKIVMTADKLPDQFSLIFSIHRDVSDFGWL